MRARAAYITSFGTTGILIAAALLMLAMVSALVAFKGWPGGAAGESVTSVPLAPPDRPVTASAARREPVARAPAARRTAPARTDRASTAGLVKQVTVRGPATVGLVTGRPAPPTASQPAPGPPSAAPPAGGNAQSPPQAPEAPPASPPSLPAPSELDEAVTGVVGQVQPPADPALAPASPTELATALAGLTLAAQQR